MAQIKRIEGKIVPALEKSHYGWPGVRDITSVPTVTVFIQSGLASVSCVGLIDTGADFCLLDEVVFKRLADQAPKPEKLLANGISATPVPLYQLDLHLCDETRKHELNFTKVPVLIYKLNRQVMIVGRRGVLELLKVEIDFPRGTISLVQDQKLDKLADRFPYMSNELPDFQRAVALIEEDATMQGIVIVANELERLLERIIALEKLESVNVDRRRLSQATLWEKLLAVSQVIDLSDLKMDFQTIVNTRNVAAHAHLDKIKELSPDSFLAATERIVSRLSTRQRQQSLKGLNSSME